MNNQQLRMKVFTAIDALARLRDGGGMPDPRMTASEFEAILPRLSRVTLGTIEVVRRVLVDGEQASDVAASAGMTRQRLYAAIKRVEHAARSFPTDWRRVEVWLPPEQAAQVEQMAEHARTQLERG